MALLRTLRTVLGIIMGERPRETEQVPCCYKHSCLCCGSIHSLVEYEGEWFCSLHVPEVPGSPTVEDKHEYRRR